MPNPSATYANSDFAADGRNRDSSGVYFDENGKPKINSGSTFPSPYTDDTKSYNEAIEKLKTYESFIIKDGYIAILKNIHSKSYENITLYGVNHLGLSETKNIVLTLKDRDVSGNKFTRRVPTNWWYADIPEWRIFLTEISDTISIEDAVFLNDLNQNKSNAEELYATQKEDIAANRTEDINNISKTLGINPDDATAYLAAGHSVKDATTKVAKWNLASPSQRKFMIAQDALLANDSLNRGDEFIEGSVANITKHEAKPVDDVFKGIRKPFSEKNTTKAYIALVQDRLNTTFASGISKFGIFTLIKLEQFYMQSVSEVDSEKYQIVETFNKPKIYFFDRRARVYQYSFVVENTGRGVAGEGNQWRDLFKNTYDEYLRGTKSVEKRVKAVIHYDEVTRIGYVLSCSMNMDSQNDNLAQVSITMFVEDEQQRDVRLTEGLLFFNPEVKKAEAQAIANPKSTKSYIEATYGSSKGINSIVINDLISNVNPPGLEKLKNPVKLLIKEITEGEQKSFVSAPTSSGKAVLADSVCTVTYTDGNVDIIPTPDGLLITLSATSTHGLAIGSSIPITNLTDGTPVFISVDTRSKFIQDIYSKQSGKDADIKYEFTLKSQDENFISISGSIKLHPATVSISVSKAGEVNAIEKVTSDGSRMRYIQLEVGTMPSTLEEPTFGKLTKVYTGTFNVQTVDLKADKIPVSLTSDSYTPIVFSVTDIIGSISSSNGDSQNLSGGITLTKLNSTTVECAVRLEVPMNEEKIIFSGESALLIGSTKIGSVDMNVKLKFVRTKDKRSFSLIKVKSLFGSDNPFPLNVDPKSNLIVSNQIELFFDKKPDDSVLREIQFIVDSVATKFDKNNVVATSVAEKFLLDIGIKSTTYYSNARGAVSVSESNKVVPIKVNVKLNVLGTAILVSNADYKSLYDPRSVITTDVYMIRCSLNFISDITINSVLVTNSPKSTQSNGQGVNSTEIQSVIKSGIIKGIIRISGSSSETGATMESAVDSVFGNKSTEYTRIPS
jgi:hypothetical protein